MVDNTKLLNLGAHGLFLLYPLIDLQPPPGPGGPARVMKGDPSTGQGSVDKACRILYGNVFPVQKFMNLNLTHAQQCKKAIKIELGTVGPGVPIFHLPYNNDQNHRVTLRDRQGIGNANTFLTEFVDGCSIYVEGSRTTPTVYHINAKQTKHVPKLFRYWTAKAKLKADWDAKYDKMDNRFQNDALHRPKVVQNALPNTLPPPTKLENQDYMAPVNLDVATLQVQQKVPNLIGLQSVDGLQLEAQQGSVFGERNAGTGEWTFYIQKRVLVGHLHVGAPAPIGYQWLVTSVEEFWPTPTTGRLV